MVFYIPFIAIPFGLCMLNCDATVTVSLINSASTADTLECGSDGIVSCRINPYANLSSWEINGKPYSTCAPGCVENPNFPKDYSPTFDVVNGVFHLTVKSATFNDSNTTFKCEDGSSFDSITIEVVPAYSEIETNVNNTVEGKQVEFKTTCVQPGVEFDWFTVKTDNSDRKTYNQGQYQMNDTTVCSNDLTCGGVGTCKVSSVITIPTIPPFSEGKQRYIEVDVTYNNPYEKKSFRFDEPFLFEDPNSSTPNTTVFVQQSITLHTTPSSDKSTSVILENGSGDGLNIVYFVIGFLLISAVFAIMIFIIYKCYNFKRLSPSPNTVLKLKDVHLKL